MDEVDKIIQSVPIPKLLPEEVFVLAGRPRRIPDIDLIINQLPDELSTYLDMEATILHSGRGGQNTFLVTLADGSYLRIRIKSSSIIELSRAHMRAGGVRPGSIQ